MKIKKLLLPVLMAKSHSGSEHPLPSGNHSSLPVVCTGFIFILEFYYV
jgi:hypothetical protein